MDDLTLNLMALFAFALIGSVIFFIVRRSQAENEQAILKLASEKGWKYESIRESLAWGLHLSSPRWTLEAMSHSSPGETAPGSSNVTMLTTWYANLPGSTLLIGARTSQVNLGGMGEVLTRQVLQLALGADAADLSEIQAGSADFRQKYMIWAQAAKQDKYLLTASLESALLNWRGEKPLIKRTSEGLTIELRGIRLQKAADLRALAELGELLLERPDL